MIRHLWEIPFDVILLGLFSVPWRVWREERAYRKDFERLHIHQLVYGEVEARATQHLENADALLKSLYLSPISSLGGVTFYDDRPSPVRSGHPRSTEDAEFARRIAARKYGLSERLEQSQALQKEEEHRRARLRLQERGFVVVRTVAKDAQRTKVEA